MKKRAIILLALALIAMALAGCGCRHKNTHLENVLEATCLQEGYSGNEVCDECGEIVKKGSVIPVGEHTLELRNVVKATCTTDGFSGDQWCTVCKKWIEWGQTIPALGHDWSEIRLLSEATCEDEGYKGRVCSRCQEEEIAGYLPMLDHEWEEKLIKEPTCTETGLKGYVCRNCGETDEVEIIPRLSHSYEEDICTVCGWHRAGEYENDELVYDWQTLLDKRLIQVDDNNRVTKLSSRLTGTLVIEENYTMWLNQYYEGTDNVQVNITGLWTPVTWTEFNLKHDGCIFANLEKLRYARIFGPVEVLPVSAFSGCTALEEVDLPSTLTSVPVGCFWNCSSLRSIKLPDTVTALEDKAFWQCTALEEAWMEGVTDIEDHVFERCSSLASIHLSKDLKRIGIEAFSECSALETVDFPEGLSGIYSGAFYKSGLTRVVLPRSASYIDNRAFAECPELKSVELHGGFNRESAYDTRNDIFARCPKLDTVTIGDDVTCIFRGMFAGCSALTELAIPEGVTYFELEAVSHTGVKDLVFPASLTEYWATSITTVYDPNSVHVDRMDFSACDQLTELTTAISADELILPKNLTTIGWRVQTPKLVLPDKLQYIKGDTTFYTRELVWPVSLVNAEKLSCEGLEQILYRGSEAKWKQVQLSDALKGVPVTFNYTDE